MIEFWHSCFPAKFVYANKSFDGGFSLLPKAESHGGAAYCALASLSLIKRLDKIDRDSVVKWCLLRQESGFQGRINKDPDTCYSFWIGASLSVI